MTALDILESLLKPNTEKFLKSLFVEDGIDYYEKKTIDPKLPLVGERSLTLTEPDDLPYIRKYTKDNFEDLKKAMIANKTGMLVEYIRSEKNEIRLLSLYLRLRDYGQL